MWVVYDRPLDHPQNIVARLWMSATPTDTIMLDDDLTELRHRIRKVAPEMLRFTRAEGDDPAIVEVWL